MAIYQHKIVRNKTKTVSKKIEQNPRFKNLVSGAKFVENPSCRSVVLSFRSFCFLTQFILS